MHDDRGLLPRFEHRVHRRVLFDRLALTERLDTVLV
jgi:hypothetical protein